MIPESAFRIAFWILFALLFVVRAYSSFRVLRAGERLMPDRAAVKREGRGMFVIRVLLSFFLVAWLVLYAINPPWMAGLSVLFPDWLRWVGFACGLASLGLLAWTQAALGKEWSPQLQLREEHHLVTTGPYSRIRHPLYSAGFGYMTSLALLTANWVFIVFAAAVILGLAARVPKEEKMMIEEFGEEYKKYIQRTGRFFPK
jgi:protein-S-isoprenylcysteine O-methyltransferase Ste14